MPEDGHAYSVGFWAGYADEGDPCTARGVIYNTSGGNPSSLRQYTESININTRMINNVTGGYYEADLLEATTMSGGTKYGWGEIFDNGAARYGQGATGYTMYRRSDADGVPPNPMGYTDASTQTRLIAYVNYEKNVAPDKPSISLPTDGATVTDTTPTYEASFSDANEVLPNGLTSDYLNAYQIQVRSVASENATSGSVVWDSGTVVASSGERSAKTMSMEHAGSALSQGTRYQVRCRHQDRFGVWSAWSHADAAAWSDFFVASGGIVTLDGSPTGTITDTTPDFQGRYHHVSGTAADRVQVRLYSGETLLATSSEITKAVNSAALPGQSFTITAGESGFGTLASGAAFGYSIRARTTTGSVWSDWSSIRTFRTNARPATPTNLAPSGGLPITTYPILTCRTSDFDGDSLTVTAYLTESDGTPIDSLAMTYDAALYSGQGGYKTAQLTSSELATYDTYKFRCDASDGDLTSALSSEAVFVYAQGPSVTIDAPTESETITTGTPLFEWTVSDQQKYRVSVYRVDDDALIYDSGQITSGTSEHAMPPDILANETDYYVIVAVEDSNPLTGTSAARAFRLEYTAPDAITGFVAFAETAHFDTEPSVVRLQWVAPTVDTDKFEGLVISRRDAPLPLSAAMPIQILMSLDQDTWVDTTPQSGVEQIYSLSYRVRESSTDVLSSAPVESSATVTLNGAVISDARDGLQLRCVFISVQEREKSHVRDQEPVNTWDGGPPWMFEGPTEYREMSLTAQLYTSEAGQVVDLLEAFRGDPAQVRPAVPPHGGLCGVRADGSPVIVCYRDERGEKGFYRVTEPTVTDRRLMRCDVEMTLVEVEYSERIAG